MKSRIHALPASVSKIVSSTLVFSAYRCHDRYGPAGASSHAPPFSASSSRPNTLGLSNRGSEHQSTLPSTPTSATERQSPISP